MRQTCTTLDVEIIQGHVSPDHVHLLVSVPPSLPVSDLLQRVTGRSRRKLMQEFGELKRHYWGGHLWARGYFAASTGNATDEVIAEYIRLQEENPLNAADGYL